MGITNKFYSKLQLYPTRLSRISLSSLARRYTRISGDFIPGIIPVADLAVVQNGTDLNLSWTARVADFDNYFIYRSADGVTFSLIATITDESVGTYADSGLSEGTYYYYITGDNAIGASSLPSDTVSAYLNFAPAAPGNLAVTAENESATLTWDPVSDPNFDKYIIYLDAVEVARVSAGTTEYTYAGLTNGSTYTFGVQAIDALGETSSTTTIVETVADTIAPATPVGLAVTDEEDNSVDLSWTANGESDLAGYNIYVDGVKNNASLIVPASYTATGLTNLTEYNFQVSAVDDAGNESALSTAVQGTPIDIVPPATPTGLALTAGNETIDAVWDAEGSGDLAGYNIYVDGVKDNASLIVPASYEISGLTNGLEYDVQVSAVDDDGNESSLSAIVSETPSAVFIPAGYTAIFDMNDMDDIRNDLSGDYYLVNDIDASGYGNWTAIGEGGITAVSPDGFTGRFDGGGHEILNLVMDQNLAAGAPEWGLFGNMSGATIYDFGLRNYVMTCNSSTKYGGGISGVMMNVTATNIYATGTFVTGGDRAGGLVGYGNSGCIFANCYADCSFSGAGSRTGVFVGYDDMLASNLTNCYYNSDKGGPGLSASGGLTALTGAYMLLEASFSGFDFTNTWSINEGYNTPQLRETGTVTDTTAPTLGLFVLTDDRTTEADFGWNNIDDFDFINEYNIYVDGVKTAASPYSTPGATVTGLSGGEAITLTAIDAEGNESAPKAPLSLGSVIDAESFETDFGDWVNGGGALLTLTRQSGSTPSMSTGPSAAQDGSWYVYAEVSGYSSNSFGMTYTLSTPKACSINGWVNMYGINITTARLQYFNGTDWITLWQLPGNQGTAWFNVQSFAPSSCEKIRWVYEHSGSYQGDAAFDNIVIKELV